MSDSHTVQLSDAANPDTALIDWLERQCVQVRTPMRYGSQYRFWASPGIEFDEQRSDLRARVVAAMAVDQLANAPSASDSSENEQTK